MEDFKRNGTATDSMLNPSPTHHPAKSKLLTTSPFLAISKRDKRRNNIATRLQKLESTFKNDRDIFYRNSLHELQNKLASLQQGTNEEYVTKKIQLEEARDYELTKLRLWEEYQVKSIEMEYHQALQKAKENHDKMIKLIKEKLYDKLQKQIKTLKEDKYLLNLLNSNSYNHDKEGGGANRDNETLAAAMGLNFHDRRSLRKRGEYLGRFATGEMDDLSDGGGGGLNGNLSWARNGSGYISSGKRRRLHTTRYSSNDEVSSSTASAKPWHNGHASSAAASAAGNQHSSIHAQNRSNGGVQSGYESNFSDKDYDALNSFIMENEDGVKSLIYDGNGLNGDDGSHTSYKVQTRGSHKQFVGPQGLKPEELNQDLALLRTAIVKKEK